MDGYVTNADTAKSDIQKIPTNANNNNKPNIEYYVDFSQAHDTTKDTIKSILNDVVGASNNGGIVGTLF